MITIDTSRMGEPGYLESLRSMGLAIEIITPDMIEEMLGVPDDPSVFYFKKGDEVKIVDVLCMNEVDKRHFMRGTDGKTFIVETALFVPIDGRVNFQSIDLVGEITPFCTDDIQLVRRP